ncbi:MAG: hypothetical protein PF439_08920 [Helicobacteraceae bacterium]|jgi:hypothetical protein|nr:hypothetical protein [Helicobacteraceae bacterium]
MKKNIIKLTSIFVISLFYGCSGHALQDLVDGKSQKKPSDTSVEKVKDDKVISPSKNSALQSISPSTTASDDHKDYRYMQKNTNEWIENEWDPLTESNSTNEKNSNIDDNNKHKLLENDNNNSLSEDDNSSFTLQHYVDKAGNYIENREKRDANKTKKPSHKEMLDTLPGIGKSTKK